MARRPRRTVSPERKGLYQVGLGLQIIAGIGILVCFIGFATSGFDSVQSHGASGTPIPFFVGFVICMVAVAGGGMIRNVAARGVAGSGLVLDPERARDDLEPWARMGGGLVKDAIDESDLAETLGKNAGGTDEEKQTVMVRCQGCRTLNDEEAKFCDNCGAEM